MPRRMLALALVVAATASACGERAEPLGRLHVHYPVTVHGANGKPTIVEAQPKQVVAVSEGPAELVDALGVPVHRVAARPNGTVDLGAVVADRPDLVVATDSEDPDVLDQITRITRAPVYVEPTSSVRNVEQAAIDVGFLLDRAVAARELVARMQTQVSRIRARVAGAPRVRVFVDTGFFATVPADSLVADLVRLAGGKLVATRPADGEPLSPRKLARLHPHVYLATSDSGVTPRTLRRDPAARRIPVVRHGRIAILPSTLVEVPGPDVTKGLAAVAQALHPDAFR